MVDPEEYLRNSAGAVERLHEMTDTIDKIAQACINALRMGNKVIFCGNGGSAADSQHLAAEFMGKFLQDRRPLPSLALTVDTSALTAIGNDFGFHMVFARQLEGIGRDGDVLVGLSTSGNSDNVIMAFHKAKEMGITTVAMVGESNDGGALAQLADIALRAPSHETPHIQECHITVGHLVCAMVEDSVVEDAQF